MNLYSYGKLLITGEYLVLDGAKAFALPLSCGQSLNYKEIDNNLIKWTSYDMKNHIKPGGLGCVCHCANLLLGLALFTLRRVKSQPSVRSLATISHFAWTY